MVIQATIQALDGGRAEHGAENSVRRRWHAATLQVSKYRDTVVNFKPAIQLFLDLLRDGKCPARTVAFRHDDEEAALAAPGGRR